MPWNSVYSACLICSVNNMTFVNRSHKAFPLDSSMAWLLLTVLLFLFSIVLKLCCNKYYRSFLFFVERQLCNDFFLRFIPSLATLLRHLNQMCFSLILVTSTNHFVILYITLNT